jgi:PAS domain S-box-containing protein
MTKQSSCSKTREDMRKKAEKIALERVARTQKDTVPLSHEETRRMLHELRVHQIELEMQNEELRTAQTALEESRARYYDLYDLAPVGYCTLSEYGLILEINLTAATILGKTRGALVRQPLTRFILKDDQDIYYLHRKQLFETGTPQVYELRLNTGKDTPVWVRIDAAPVQEADGASVCRAALIDISRRKLAETERERLQARLTQAQKMEAVGRLAGGVAHDFNNMLGIILGYTELAIDRVGPDEPLKNDLSEIRKAALHSADLTRQLLAFARKQVIAPRVIDLNEAVDGMIKMLRQLIGEGIAMDWKPGGHLWPIEMDPGQINQILAKLCMNARDSIPDIGKITVETRNTVITEEICTLQQGLTPGDYVMLTVSDDGTGMDSETLLLIFDPFFTTKETGKGTGLGLASVYGIVKQNSGFIHVDSELDRGTTFTVYLPRYRGKTESPPKQVAAQTPVRGRETILLVEDEPAILRMTTILLEHQGYSVLVASSPCEAIRIARERTFGIDLLLTDVVMPEMNGCDLRKALLSIIPSLKCLFMSGYTADIIAHHGVLNTGEHFIQKPFSIKELEAKLRKALES